MVKKKVNLYLEDKDIQKLLLKANASGFEGRGAISFYIQKIITEPIIFLSKEILLLLESNRRKIQ